MPGTIQISVLELRNLPSPLSPSSLSIRVTMGKREYMIAVDKGEFSIPLTTLRENMLFKVFDANGIEICRTGIETKKVVEKGLWNDTFPLEGGGEMLLKLQFVLSEEERNRIRMMRLSALKKREDELVGTTPLLPEKVPAPSLGYDKGSGVEEPKEFRLTDKSAISQEVAATSRTVELNNPNQDTTMESTDGGEDPRSSLISVDATARISETSSRKQVKISNPEQTSSSAPRELKEAVRDVQGPSGKAPSSIRTMISAFESGLAQESRASLTTFDGNIKTSTKSPEDENINQELEGHVSQTEEAVSDPQREEQKLMLRGEIEEQFGLATVSNDDSDSSPPAAETSTSPDSDGSDIRKEKSRARIGYSLDKMGWDDFCDDEEIPGIWIFPDDTRSICITTGGKHAAHLMERCVETITASMTKHLEEGTMPRKNENDANEGERRSSASGPSGQAMRIAVMVGFGVLVLFTRRKRR